MKLRYFLTSLILSVSFFVGVVFCSFVRSEASGDQLHYVTYADYDARSAYLTVIDAVTGTIYYSNKLYYVCSSSSEYSDYVFTAKPILDYCLFNTESSQLFGWYGVSEFGSFEAHRPYIENYLFCPQTGHALYQSETDPLYFWESDGDYDVYVFVNSWFNSPNQSSGFSISGWWSWASGLMLVFIAGLFIIFSTVKSKD